LGCNNPGSPTVDHVPFFVQKANLLHNKENYGAEVKMSIVKSLSVGEGDMFYIKHGAGADSFTIIDCCMSEEERRGIVNLLKTEAAGKGITRFISTHPDDDHISGLAYLHGQMGVVNFYCVKNAVTKEDETEDFNQYCALRDSDKAFHIYNGRSRKWLNETDEARGGAGISILWPVTGNKHYQEALAAAAAGESPNNISAIVEYSLNGGATFLWMGDLNGIHGKARPDPGPCCRHTFRAASWKGQRQGSRHLA
jgi:beta-lactamase superfamily II metal-dependent hydrolase